MQVEADNDRYLVAHHAAHAGQQLALAVVVVLGHHRAVQVQVHAIDRQGFLQPRNHLASDALIGIARDAIRR